MTQNHNYQQPFRGFDVPRQNWFRLPFDWTDITADITSLAELKVVEYVLKHTWGYREYDVAKCITIDEFMHGRKRKDGSRLDRGTGLSNRSVIDGLRRAVKDGYLVEQVDDHDKARVKKFYALKMCADFEPPEVKDEGKADVKKVHTPAMKKVHSCDEEPSQRTETEYLDQIQQQCVVDLVEKGIAEQTARQLATTTDPARIAEKIDILNHLLETDPAKAKSPAGWLVTAIKKDWPAPSSYQTPEERAAAAAAAEHAQQKREKAAEARKAHEAAEQAHRVQQWQKSAERVRADLGAPAEAIAQACTVWSEARADLIARGAAFQTHLATSELLTVENGRAVLAVGNDYAAGWVGGKLAKQVGEAITRYYGQPVQLEVMSLQPTAKS